MLKKFKELIEMYSSQELGMQTLKELEVSGLVSFDNQGISRSNTDCLLCVISFNKLVQFKDELLSCHFDSYRKYEAFINASGFAFEKDPGDDEAYVTHSAEEGFFEIACSIEDDGRVEVESEDIKLQEKFNVYLRVQH